MVIAGIFVVLTFLIFVEEVRFIIHHFEIVTRRVKTIWVLAIYPVSNRTWKSKKKKITLFIFPHQNSVLHTSCDVQA